MPDNFSLIAEITPSVQASMDEQLSAPATQSVVRKKSNFMEICVIE